MKKLIYKYFFLYILILSSAFALDFKVASYNIENLFDLNYDGTEYNEFIPNKTNWNQETLDIKIKNISKAINDLDADILAIQEIESIKALELLLSNLKQYKYYTFIKNQKSAVGVAVISKYEITNTQAIDIDTKNNYSRPILEADIKIDNKNLKIFVNHWRSKSASESSRIPYAKALYNRLIALPKNTNYILLGDFNSNYDEFETFKYDKKLNDTHGITAINDILKTSIKGHFITKHNILNYQELVHYNLWLELPFYERYSYKFKGSPNTPDSIIIPQRLLHNNSDITYIDDSFGVFKPEYLYKKGHIQRWQMDKKGFHKKQGYSDHLPIFAYFSTSYTTKKPKQKLDLNKISTLYNMESLASPITLPNVVVLYKTAHSAIIKQENERAIFIYNSAKELEVGQIYDLTIDKISSFNGQKQISGILAHIQNGNNKEYKKLFIDGTKVDLTDFKIQNEIITNLKGEYIKKDLHYGDKKIRVYSKNKDILPPQNAKILIKSAHLSIYNNIPQLVIYSKNDYEIIK
ncbi:endonuclease/exonuclease/phosphatase family protein [Arcobacter sp. FWKO B]|uniref:endonuclease/exonuclease/phosphatase family protein n=1 Tax=Arcobacter sp. FWKO B TaxID=2593672 RepID=UPI0018A4C54F|nr:endonuclease/exonuclease/phosphatase family protein [Arcobacter sp. FWKO B]QOG13200.1 endonuclease/exonuclease/phosphatase family protein [Arcobacter sp. FWKO B]